MDITADASPDPQSIQGYGPGAFRIAGRIWTGGVLVFRGRTLAWPVASIEELMPEALDEVRTAEPAIDFLVLGLGERTPFLPPSQRVALVGGGGFVIEPMSTPAACRTWNVLLAENRRVAAALMPMPPSE